MDFQNYQNLVNIIGTKYKSGEPEATADFVTLNHDILIATSTFELDATERVRKIINDASSREPCPEEADRKTAAAAARESINGLAAKYGVEPVFDPDPRKVAEDMANLFLNAILRDQ